VSLQEGYNKKERYKNIKRGLNPFLDFAFLDFFRKYG
jgi:hypothetical protein